MSSKTYSFKHCNILISGIKKEGFGEEGGVTITRDEGKWVTTVGADGRVSRSFVASNSGTVELNLMQTAEANSQLDALHKTDVATLKGQIPVFIQDTLGGSTYSAEDAWIVGPPEVTLNKGVEEYTWTLQCENLAMYVAGGEGGFIAGAVNSISSALGLGN